MALAPSAMQMLRRGPAMGPAATPGGAGGAPPGAATGMPATPGAQDPNNILMAAISDQMNQAKKANANFLGGNIDHWKNGVSAAVVHVQQAHPDVARHLNRAWASLDQAAKALKDAMSSESPGVGPPLGFSGAQMGPTQAGPPGMGSGGMGVPS